jgi:hypothetical protein
MNAPADRENDALASIARQDELRDIIAEMLWGCGLYSNTGLNFIELTDDAALEYSIKQLIARVKVARDVMAMLKASKARPAEIAGAA